MERTGRQAFGMDHLIDDLSFASFVFLWSAKEIKRLVHILVKGKIPVFLLGW